MFESSKSGKSPKPQEANTATTTSWQTNSANNQLGLIATNKPYLLEANNPNLQNRQAIKPKVIEKTVDRRSPYYQFAWIGFFPFVLATSWLLKLKNRHLANEEHYLQHQLEFFSFFRRILERVGYEQLIRTDKFHKLRPLVVDYAIDGSKGSDLRMLDVATGFGFQAQALKEAGVAFVYGIDVVPERIRGAKELHGELGVNFMVMDAAEMEFPEDYFDSTVVSCALHDMPNRIKIQVLREMVRVTKPGGNMVILEPRTFKNPWIGWLLGIVGELLDESLNMKDYVMDDLNTILEALNLRIIKEENLYTAKVLNLKLVRVDISRQPKK